MSLREGRFRNGSGDIIQQLGPLVYWKCNELTGTTIKDSSGNTNDGTASGGFTLNQPGPLGNAQPGILGDGISGLIASGVIDITLANTILFFGKMIALPAFNARQLGTHGANTCKLQYANVSGVYNYFCGGGGVGPANVFNNVILANNFYFLCGKCNGVDTVSIFQNILKNLAVGSPTDPTAGALNALGQAATNFSNMIILACAVFNKELTDNQIFQIYQLMRHRIMASQ